MIRIRGLTKRYAGGAMALRGVDLEVVRGEFAPPAQHRPGVSKALQAICLQAMSRRPGDRYATAMQLADDVERYLADEPVQAFNEPLDRTLARWSRRHRRVVQTAAPEGPHTSVPACVVPTFIALGVV